MTRCEAVLHAKSLAAHASLTDVGKVRVGSALLALLVFAGGRGCSKG